MEGIAYDCKEDRYGGILITNCKAKKTCYLQGDDATVFQKDWDTLIDLWSKGEKPESVFTCYEEHIDYICSGYDTIMEEEEEGGNI